MLKLFKTKHEGMRLLGRFLLKREGNVINSRNSRE